jgi:hypothetical protein
MCVRQHQRVVKSCVELNQDVHFKMLCTISKLSRSSHFAMPRNIEHKFPVWGVGEDRMLHMWPKTWQAILDRLREKISFIICVRCSVAVSSKSWRSIRAYTTTAIFGSTSVSHTFKMPLDFPVRIPLYNPSIISNGTSSKDSVWSPIASIRLSLQLSSSSPL